ncbi:tetratricopeptide repeat protein [Ructibacterium gallinarum]|uniref:Uncharacterized protein n=1 Tax=Ructibacterium gallinarum TaxID=2779355 RepID=A0A9D5M1L5_9FIRM|nr:tetratricopeptide repeat protein [Ructibacterium gallinarum]MBE5039743.1 hypothetical protein [Ructibacterium gallinarum]
MKRLVCILLAVLAAAAALSGCGKKEEPDYYMQGYDAVKAGKYEEALEAFETAAKQGDEQAETAAEIVSGYLNAQEAYMLGNLESAKAFLKEIPENYKYYAIGEDIDALRQKVYSGNMEEVPEEPKESDPPATDRPEMTEESKLSVEKEEEFSRREETDLELQQIHELIKSGYLDQAKERLNSLPSDMTDGQRQKAEQYRSELSDQQKNDTQENKKSDTDFTPEKAAEYVRRQYQLEGDLGDGLVAKYDADGNKYYELMIQSGSGDDAEILTLHVFGDGTVQVTDRR